jgi:hypothetical protein
MKFKHLAVGTLLAAGMAVLPVSSMAATSQSCAPGKVTSESYTWDFKAEASKLLDGIQADAVQARNRAETIETLNMKPEISWKVHAEQLTAIKREINDMGRKMCRLEQIRRVVAPWQQQAIDRIAPRVTLMANSAQDAIDFLNANQSNFWEPVYQRYTSNMIQDSARIARSVKNFDEYAKARGEEMHLQKSLGVKAGA